MRFDHTLGNKKALAHARRAQHRPVWQKRHTSIEAREQVWQVIRAVKTEFAKFGGVLDKLGRQLDTAKRTVDETGVRTRAMERKLKGVETLPGAESTKLLELPEEEAEEQD